MEASEEVAALIQPLQQGPRSTVSRSSLSLSAAAAAEFLLGGGGLIGVEVRYHDHVFEYEPSPGEMLVGRLVLDDCRRELLVALTASEDEGLVPGRRR